MDVDAERTERRARAEEVVSRVRFARWAARRADGLAGLVAVLLPAVTVGLALAAPLVPGQALGRQLDQSALVTALLVIGYGVVVLGMIALVVAVGVAFAMAAGAGVVTALLGPWELLVWGARRRAEALLLAEGEVPAGWVAGRAWRRTALARLAGEDDALVRAGDGLTLRPTPPRLRCDGCGAWLRSVGQGLRRCDPCGRERYEALPRMSDGLAAARRGAGGAAGARSRRAMYTEALLREADDGLDWFRWGGRIAAWVFGAAALADLVWLVTGRAMTVVSILAVVGVALGALPICGAWAYGLYRVAVAAVSVRPGVRAYDDAMAREIVRVVLGQGRIGLTALAVHLEVTPELLRSQVARLEAYGRLPLFRDRAGDALLALQVVGSATNACPACGGRLVAAPGGRQRCAHCGGLSLGRAA